VEVSAVMRIQATEVDAGEDEDIFCLSFGYAAGAVAGYLTLQRAKEFDEQDRQLGLDDVHIEWNDQGMGAYGGMTAVELHTNRLLIVLDAATAAELGLGRDTNIEVRFAVSRESFGELRDALAHIFEGRPYYADKTA
jgi:hypothetical protein